MADASLRVVGGGAGDAIFGPGISIETLSFCEGVGCFFLEGGVHRAYICDAIIHSRLGQPAMRIELSGNILM